MQKSDLTEPHSESVEIADIQKVHKNYLDILFHSPYIAEHALPGQFVMVRSRPDGDPVMDPPPDPLLLRPFDIMEVSPEAGTFRIMVKVEGSGTRLLAALSPGSRVTVTGPLGRGIISLDASRIALLVRGVGAAAVTLTAGWALDHGIEVYTFLSASSAELLVCREYLEAVSTELHIVTDDGSDGAKGDARDIFSMIMKKKEDAGTPIEAVFTCGSRRFARFVGDLAHREKLQGYLFLEEYMACGMGDCHGCAVRKSSGDGYFLVCQDGPVFDAREVVFE